MRTFRIEGEELPGGRWKVTLEGHEPVFTVDPVSTVEAMTCRLVRNFADVILPASSFQDLIKHGEARHHVIGFADSPERSPLGPVGRKLTVSDGRRSGAKFIDAVVTAGVLTHLQPETLKSIEEFEEIYGPGSARPRPVWIYTITNKEA